MFELDAQWKNEYQMVLSESVPIGAANARWRSREANERTGAMRGRVEPCRMPKQEQG